MSADKGGHTMPASIIHTPAGVMPIPDYVQQNQAQLSDREVAEKTFAGGLIHPFGLAELLHRGLCKRGWIEADVWAEVERREAAA